MEIKIISSQPKGVMAQDEKIRFGSKGLCMVSGGSEVEKGKQKRIYSSRRSHYPLLQTNIHSFSSLCHIILSSLVIFSFLFSVLSYYIEIILICQV